MFPAQIRDKVADISRRDVGTKCVTGADVDPAGGATWSHTAVPHRSVDRTSEGDSSLPKVFHFVGLYCAAQSAAF